MSTHGASSGSGGSRSARGVAERARSNTGGAAVTVNRFPGADEAMRALFGHRLSNAQMARLTATEPGGTVRVMPVRFPPGDSRAGIVYISKSPGSYQNGTIEHDGRGRVFLNLANAKVDESRRGQGVGTLVFARQAKEASAQGIVYGHLEAARLIGNGPSGYRFWPSVGWNAKLPDGFAGIAEHFRAQDGSRVPRGSHLRTVLDLYQSIAGRELWQRFGDNLHMAFSFRPGSRSMRVLQDNLARHGIKWSDV